MTKDNYEAWAMGTILNALDPSEPEPKEEADAAAENKEGQTVEEEPSDLRE